MEKTRLETLQEMLAADPGDSFARYAIAQEHVKRGDFETARAGFEELRTRDPEYVATYYHLGQIYQKLGRTEDARRIYHLGIDTAGRKGDLHSKSELCDVLDLLEGA